MVNRSESQSMVILELKMESGSLDSQLVLHPLDHTTCPSVFGKQMINFYIKPTDSYPQLACASTDPGLQSYHYSIVDYGVSASILRVTHLIVAVAKAVRKANRKTVMETKGSCVQEIYNLESYEKQILVAKLNGHCPLFVYLYIFVQMELAFHPSRSFSHVNMEIE